MINGPIPFEITETDCIVLVKISLIYLYLAKDRLASAKEGTNAAHNALLAF